MVACLRSRFLAMSRSSPHSSASTSLNAAAMDSMFYLASSFNQTLRWPLTNPLMLTSVAEWCPPAGVGELPALSWRLSPRGWKGALATRSSGSALGGLVIVMPLQSE